MKKLVNNYNFHSATNQVVFSQYGQIDQNNILLITNTTDNIIIYNFANPTLGGTVSGNTLTLNYSTIAMSDTDNLQIFYDDPDVNINIQGESGDTSTAVNDREVIGVLYEILETLKEVIEKLDS